MTLWAMRGELVDKLLTLVVDLKDQERTANEQSNLPHDSVWGFGYYSGKADALRDVINDLEDLINKYGGEG